MEVDEGVKERGQGQKLCWGSGNSCYYRAGGDFCCYAAIGGELADLRNRYFFKSNSAKASKGRNWRPFYLLFYFVILVGPCIGLFPNWFSAGIYAVAAIVVFAFHYRAMAIVYPKGDRDESLSVF